MDKMGSSIEVKYKVIKWFGFWNQFLNKFNQFWIFCENFRLATRVNQLAQEMGQLLSWLA
jgi:hypothetical protein